MYNSKNYAVDRLWIIEKYQNGYLILLHKYVNKLAYNLIYFSPKSMISIKIRNIILLSKKYREMTV